MFYDVVGWVGMALVLIAYALLSLNKIKNGTLYQTLNLLAGVLMAIGLFPKNAWFSFTLQIIWATIALYSIFMLIRKKRHKKAANSDSGGSVGEVRSHHRNERGE